MDEIVAAAAFNHIMAVSADQDVAGLERRDAFTVDTRPWLLREQIPEQFLEAVDSVDARPGQHMIGHVELDFDLLRRAAVVAAQHVVVVPARQTLCLVEPIA
ncbi:hypothetical protein D9M69_705070 [compost metagenome]